MDPVAVVVAVTVPALVASGIVTAPRLESPWLQPVAIARATVQLGLLGVVLTGVLAHGVWVLVFLAVMVVAATAVVLRRTGRDRGLARAGRPAPDCGDPRGPDGGFHGADPLDRPDPHHRRRHGAFVGVVFAGSPPLEAAGFQLLVLASILAAGGVCVAALGWLLGAPTQLPRDVAP